MGDGRTYEFVVALRAVQTTDFMTAHWAELPYDSWAARSSRIINEVRGINRVTYEHLLEAARHDRVGVTRVGWDDAVHARRRDGWSGGPSPWRWRWPMLA
jgi:hypothetical protein